jgi:HAD superfamily hydrolase (TIGR01509 family)
MLQALIFDVDGTLAETEELHRQAFNDTFAAHGLDWVWDRPLYAELLAVTGGKERMLHYLSRHRPDQLAELRAEIPALHARKTQVYGALVESGGLDLRPGVARLITEAKQDGLRLAIATTTSRPNVMTLLRSLFPLSGEHLFDIVVAGDEVPRKKPAPDVYDAALAALCLLPEDCIAFEDSANGVIAACGAGLSTIATPSLYTDRASFKGALAVLSDLGEPTRPYEHCSGAGREDACVDLDALVRWTGALRRRPTLPAIGAQNARP